MQLDLLLVSLYLEGAIIIFSMSTGSPGTRWLGCKGSGSGRGRCRQPVPSERGWSLQLTQRTSSHLRPWLGKAELLPTAHPGEGDQPGCAEGGGRGSATAGGCRGQAGLQRCRTGGQGPARLPHESGDGGGALGGSLPPARDPLGTRWLLAKTLVSLETSGVREADDEIQVDFFISFQ